MRAGVVPNACMVCLPSATTIDSACLRVSVTTEQCLLPHVAVPWSSQATSACKPSAGARVSRCAVLPDVLTCIWCCICLGASIFQWMHPALHTIAFQVVSLLKRCKKIPLKLFWGPQAELEASAAPSFGSQLHALGLSLVGKRVLVKWPTGWWPALVLGFKPRRGHW